MQKINLFFKTFLEKLLYSPERPGCRAIASAASGELPWPGPAKRRGTGHDTGVDAEHIFMYT